MGYKWDCETILEHIRRRVERGRSISPSGMKADNPNLFYAAKYHFGSYSRAVRIAVDPGYTEEPPKDWTERIVIDDLSERYHKGEDLSYTTMRSSVLMKQAKKFFGSWKAAIEAAGIPYVEVSRYGWGITRTNRNG